MNKLLIVCGPTGTGKTALAFTLAKQFNGELVSADSRQVYTGMDIATGKDVGRAKSQPASIQGYFKDEEYELVTYTVHKIPVWLYDVVTPDSEFSVAAYASLARQVFADIWRRGKLPILVGGTGLYIRSLLEGIETSVIPPDASLRARLSGKSVHELQDELRLIASRDFAKLNDSDRKNPRRLVRKIEIVRYMSHEQKFPTVAPIKREASVMQVGITAPLPILLERIGARVNARIEAGILQEVETLSSKYSWSLPAMSGLGYREWRPFLDKKQSKETCIERWIRNEYQYAKRQMTWFKKDKSILWFDPTIQGYPQAVVERVRRWYTNK